MLGTGPGCIRTGGASLTGTGEGLSGIRSRCADSLYASQATARITFVCAVGAPGLDVRCGGSMCGRIDGREPQRPSVFGGQAGYVMLNGRRNQSSKLCMREQMVVLHLCIYRDLYISESDNRTGHGRRGRGVYRHLAQYGLPSCSCELIRLAHAVQRGPGRVFARTRTSSSWLAYSDLSTASA